MRLPLKMLCALSRSPPKSSISASGSPVGFPVIMSVARWAGCAAAVGDVGEGG